MAPPAKPPDPACPVCSKPVASGSLVFFQHGELCHIRCVSQVHQRRGMEQVARAQAAETRAVENIDRATRLIEDARRLRQLRECAVCQRPIRAADGYVRGSDGTPIHVECPRPE